MKIVIVGAGITGLSTYLFLKKLLPIPSTSPTSSHIIKIYESHAPKPTSTSTTGTTTDDPFENIIGAGLGLNPNGVRVLGALSAEIRAAFIAQGFQAKKFNFRTAGNRSLGTSSTKDGKEPQEFCVATSRHGLQKVLMDAVEEGVVVYREVSGVRTRNEDGGRAVVYFADGDEDEEADLVVGADGVNSVVKRSLFSVEDAGKFAAQYQGTLGVGGFITVPENLPYDKESMVFTMGPTGTFGYSGGSDQHPNYLMYWSSYESKNVPQKCDVIAEDVRRLLHERHKNWEDPIIQFIINKSTIDTVWPMWITPKLPHWGRKGVILMGDAAHAISPTTGQGASMALQDAEMLATLIAEAMREYDDEKKAIDNSIAGLYDLRHKKLAEIQRRAINPKGSGSEPSVIRAMVVYAILWLVFTVKPIGTLLFGDMPKLFHQDAEMEVKEYLRTKRSDAWPGTA